MTSIEELLARDVAAVTGGVDMTQAELEQARDEVEQRIEVSRRGSRRRVTLAVAATAAVVAGVGAVALAADPAGEADSAPAGGPESDDPYASFLLGEAPTEEAIQGVWRVDNGMTLVRFHGDDEVAFDTRGQITTAEITGTYTLEGDQVVVALDDGARPGCTGEVAFRAAVPNAGEMRMVVTEPAPLACGFEQDGRWVLEHMLPTRPGYIGFGPADDDVTGPLREAVLPGFWMVVGGGYGLQLTPGNTYYVLGGDGESIELGQWWLERGDLVLESESSCRVVLGDVEHMNPGTDMIRGTITEHRCEMPWVSGDSGSTMEWFQVPDRSSD